MKIVDACKIPSNRLEEYKIDKGFITTEIKDIPIYSEEDLCQLKNKVINDYYGIIGKLECGILPELEILLEQISLIDIYYELV